MRYLVSLAVLTLTLSGFDLWFTCARSLIPRSLDSTVVELQLRNEKHPGVDDVCLVRTSDNQLIHVDAHVYSNLAVQDQLMKARGAREIAVNGEPLQLKWSQDARGMAYVMPIILTLAAGLTTLAGLRLKTERAK